MKKLNYSKGIKFKCQGSSNCCISRNSYGYVYLSKKDILNLSKFTNLNSKDFIKLYCDKTDGFIHFKEKNKKGKCIFLDKKKCSIYEARPTQCRTWPFWSENMNAKIWNEEISKFCPGINQGKLFTKENIDKIIKEDEDNENTLLNLST